MTIVILLLGLAIVIVFAWAFISGQKHMLLRPEAGKKAHMM